MSLTHFDAELIDTVMEAFTRDILVALGFGSGGATLEDVALMRRVVGSVMGVKAAVGIRTLVDAEEMVKAGATRIGTSASVRIVHEAKDEMAPNKKGANNVN